MRCQTAVLTALMSLTFMMSMAAMAHAQASATTFAELRGRLVIGETVFVTIRILGITKRLTNLLVVTRLVPDQRRRADARSVTMDAHGL